MSLETGSLSVRRCNSELSRWLDSVTLAVKRGDEHHHDLAQLSSTIPPITAMKRGVLFGQTHSTARYGFYACLKDGMATYILVSLIALVFRTSGNVLSALLSRIIMRQPPVQSSGLEQSLGLRRIHGFEWACYAVGLSSNLTEPCA